MTKFRHSIRPHLAGFLRIDLAVMTTCCTSLALVLILQGPQSLNSPEISIPVLVSESGGDSSKLPRIASLSRVSAATFDSTVGFADTRLPLLR